MREILYVQAGQLANYVGSHFWNAQESYMTSEDDSIVHERSFREGTSKEGNCYTPRAIIFDKKDHFGTAPRTHSSIQTEHSASNEPDPSILWNGGVIEYRQDAIPPPKLDEEEEDEEDGKEDQCDRYPESVRYWSDFSRVYYHPRSFQRMPDIYDFDAAGGEWQSGGRIFKGYDEDVSLMEDGVRPFLEECDTPQGIQVVDEASTFGPFVNTFLDNFRDEFVKLPCIVFPLLSDTYSWNPDVDDKRGIRRLVNDALHLRALSDDVSLAVPIQSPSSWAKKDSLYTSSAIISAHIESATLALRHSESQEDLSSFADLFTAGHGSAPFAELCGCFPGDEGGMQDFFNYTHGVPFSGGFKKVPIYSRRDTMRGFNSLCASSYETWSADFATPPWNVTRTHGRAVPVPRGLPSEFNVESSERSPVASVFSSVLTSTKGGVLFKKYAEFVDVSRRRKDIFLETDEADELHELVNDLWTLHDTLSGDAGYEEDDTAGDIEDD
ncbi:tubulin nucleotide-binding domain-like protein [Cylindrobasidium torrendii FP15055 ss-10]|uniref:Tubulin nucleotide-binding domain-like protein n=1 Tax=Cylindrobasidium torrendii FP15055 ss-10 TaxID=1314674 RepID=A0A0D7BB53_9AGAR|nr:tubulin nucleotide-binding domain-like protein [Cylindrobasidium torrendii FP15055 ss-10]